MGQVLIGYTGFIIGLFTPCLVVTGLKATLLVFGIIHFSCTLGVLALWWREERRGFGTARAKDLEAPVPAVNRSALT
jgi:hypothetical protein